MKKTTFSCLEMKHHGAQIVAEKISQMTTKEEVLFWKDQTRHLAKNQALVKQSQACDLERENA